MRDILRRPHARIVDRNPGPLSRRCDVPPLRAPQSTRVQGHLVASPADRVHRAAAWIRRRMSVLSTKARPNIDSLAVGDRHLCAESAEVSPPPAVECFPSVPCSYYHGQKRIGPQAAQRDVRQRRIWDETKNFLWRCCRSRCRGSDGRREKECRAGCRTRGFGHD